MTTSLQLWENAQQLGQIKEQYGRNLSQPEWNLFLQIGKATGLNPFLREIYCVKYGSAPASIFIGRDGYRRSAQTHPEYEYHYADAVYSNDLFENNDGVLTHKYKLTERGTLVGAYCMVKRRSSPKPVMNFVELREYTTGKSVWASKPATMIKKVAEAQGLRGSFQELFAGTYEESEDFTKNGQVVDAQSAPTEPPKVPPTVVQVMEAFTAAGITLEKLAALYQRTGEYKWTEEQRKEIDECYKNVEAKLTKKEPTEQEIIDAEEAGKAA